MDSPYPADLEPRRQDGCANGLFCFQNETVAAMQRDPGDIAPAIGAGRRLAARCVATPLEPSFPWRLLWVGNGPVRKPPRSTSRHSCSPAHAVRRRADPDTPARLVDGGTYRHRRHAPTWARTISATVFSSGISARMPPAIATTCPAQSATTGSLRRRRFAGN